MADRTVTVHLRADIASFTDSITRAASQVDRLSARLSTFDTGNYSPRVGITDAAAQAEIDRLTRQLASLGRSTSKPSIDVDDADAMIRLHTVQTEIASLDRQVAAARLTVDDTDARAKLSDLEARLIDLGRKTANPSVDIGGVARAEADIAAVKASLASLDGSSATVSVNQANGGGGGGLGGLGLAAAVLSPAAIPIGASAVQGIAGAAQAMSFLAGGAGVAKLALSGIPDAIKAIDKANASSAVDQTKAAATQKAADDTLAASRNSLANVEATARDQSISAAEAVTRARQGVATAAESAANQVTQAESRVVTAEQSLATAQYGARQAEDALTASRQTAARQLEDLRLQVEDGALSQEQATLSVAQAKRTLDQTMALSTDPLARQQADLSYREAVQQLEDITVRNQQLRTDKAAADKAGVEGSAQVQTALHNVATTQQDVATRSADLAKAEADVTTARRDGARQVAAAQQAVSDALRSQQAQQRQSAYTIAQAQLAEQRAVEGVAKAATDAGGAGSTALNDMNQSLAALGPAGASFAIFLDGIKTRLRGLQAIAQEGLLPGLQAGISSALGLLPDLGRLVGNIASSMGGLAREAGAALDGPFWRKFVDFLAAQANPTITTLGHVVGDVAHGLAGLWEAFGPLAGEIGQSLETLAGRFASWGEQFGSSSEFAAFVAYVHANGPLVASTLLSIGRAIGAVVVAAAPAGPVILQIVRGLADLVALIASSPVGPGLVGISLGFLAVSKAMAVLKGTAIASWLTGLISPIGATSAALLGLKAALPVLAIGGGLVYGFVQLRDALKPIPPNVDAITASLVNLAKNGVDTGELEKVYGPQLENLGKKLGLALSRGMSGEGFVGGLLDVKGQFGLGSHADDARAQLDSVDKAMAGLVTSGHADIAAQQFDRMAASLKGSGKTTADLRKALDDYEKALVTARTQQQLNNTTTDQGSASQRALADQLHTTSQRLDDASKALDDQQQALQATYDPVIAVGRAFSQQAQAQQAVNDAIKAYGVGSQQAKDASLGLLDSTLGLNGSISSLRQAVLAGTLSFDGMRTQLQQWVGQGIITQGQADAVASAISGIHKQVTSLPSDANVAVSQTGADPTIQALGGVANATASVPRSIDIGIRADTSAAYAAFKAFDLNLHTAIINDPAFQMLGVAGAPPFTLPKPNPAVIMHRASGGPLHGGQLSWVGEAGPELIRTASPAYVYDHADSIAMTARPTPAIATPLSVASPITVDAKLGGPIRLHPFSITALADALAARNASLRITTDTYAVGLRDAGAIRAAV